MTGMRYAMGIEYDGGDFLGWQQLGQGRPSLQSVIQDALSKVANAPTSVICAGRTDAGVHARCQVIHFDSDAPRLPHHWVFGTTSAACTAVAVRWCVPVSIDFHARFSACARRYTYSLINRPVRPALGRNQLGWVSRHLNVDAMQCAAQLLLGEHDFSAFRGSQCQAVHARRCLQTIAVERHGEMIQFHVQANAFLHHMVRNIVGTLVSVGLGKKPPQWVQSVLQGRCRAAAGATAPPQGLVFVGPLYDADWGLPGEVSVAHLDTSAFPTSCAMGFGQGTGC